jgi:hypothetical protein
MRISLALLFVLTFAACNGMQAEDPAPHASGLRFPERIGELGRLETKPGKDASGIDVTYGWRKAKERGLLCRVVVEPATSTAATAEEVLVEEWRVSVQRHDKTLRSGDPGEERFDVTHPFRGATIPGMGLLTKKKLHSEVWESWIVTYLIDGWNVTFVGLERDPDESLPPLAVEECAAAFLRENSP